MLSFKSLRGSKHTWAWTLVLLLPYMTRHMWHPISYGRFRYESAVTEASRILSVWPGMLLGFWENKVNGRRRVSLNGLRVRQVRKKYKFLITRIA